MINRGIGEGRERKVDGSGSRGLQGRGDGGSGGDTVACEDGSLDEGGRHAWAELEAVLRVRAVTRVDAAITALHPRVLDRINVVACVWVTLCTHTGRTHYSG